MRRFAEFREELEEKATEEEGSRAEQLEEENFIDPFDSPHESERVCGAVNAGQARIGRGLPGSCHAGTGSTRKISVKSGNF